MFFLLGAIYVVLGTAAMSTVGAKHSVRAASSVGSEKDKLRTRTTGFVKRKIGLAKDHSLIWFQQGKTFGRKVYVRICLCLARLWKWVCGFPHSSK